MIDYALASESIIRTIIDFNTGVNITSTHMPQLLELENEINKMQTLFVKYNYGN